MAGLVSKQITVIVSFVVLNLFAMVATGLRFYSMKLVHRKVKIHDFLCIMSLVMLIAYSIILLIGKSCTAYNCPSVKTDRSNRHDHGWYWASCSPCSTIKKEIGLKVPSPAFQGQATEELLTWPVQAFFSSQFFWAISIASFRLAILALYVQAFPTKVFQYFAYGAMSIVCLFFVGSITTTLAICRPIASNWDENVKGKCGDEGTAELAAAAFNMALDIGIVILPVPVIWGLHMSKQKKAAVIATFALSLG